MGAFRKRPTDRCLTLWVDGHARDVLKRYAAVRGQTQAECLAEFLEALAKHVEPKLPTFGNPGFKDDDDPK